MWRYCRVRPRKRPTAPAASAALNDRKFATAPNSRSPRALRTDPASPMSAWSQVTSSGSERCLAFWPRFSTETDMPAATERRTHEALIVPVPPMYRTLRSVTLAALRDHSTGAESFTTETTSATRRDGMPDACGQMGHDCGSRVVTLGMRG